jgi:hypothetical protein
MDTCSSFTTRMSPSSGRDLSCAERGSRKQARRESDARGDTRKRPLLVVVRNKGGHTLSIAPICNAKPNGGQCGRR